MKHGLIVNVYIFSGLTDRLKEDLTQAILEQWRNTYHKDKGIPFSGYRITDLDAILYIPMYRFDREKVMRSLSHDDLYQTIKGVFVDGYGVSEEDASLLRISYTSMLLTRLTMLRVLINIEKEEAE